MNNLRDNMTQVYMKLNYESMVVPWWRYDMKICKSIVIDGACEPSC